MRPPRRIWERPAGRSVVNRTARSGSYAKVYRRDGGDDMKDLNWTCAPGIVLGMNNVVQLESRHKVLCDEEFAVVPHLCSGKLSGTNDARHVSMA
jgi:hypothetical protein